MPARSWFLSLSLLGCLAPVFAAERYQPFDADPKWEGRNHRSTAFDIKTIRQDFGHSPTNHAGGAAPGEMGGWINPAAESAYYAMAIPRASFDNRLTASGKLSCAGRQFHLLVGFFNSTSLNEWRTPNTIALRLLGRGDRFFAYVEYCTSRWRAGGDSPGGFATTTDPATGRAALCGFSAQGTVHAWSLTYDPAGHDGAGSITVTLDNETAVCHLEPDHRRDDATFDRFGLLPVMKQWDDGGEVWLDDVTVNGHTEHFDRDPGWSACNNRRTYQSAIVRPRFDFGFSPTHFAGGQATGELGGLVFRGDIREPHRTAFYADFLEPLSLEKPLRASGKVSLRRAVSDSTTLIGFFHSRYSTAVNPSQATGFPSDFLGIAIEGPSSQGFLFYPACRVHQGDARYTYGPQLPHIFPDGRSHQWELRYTPRDDGAADVLVLFDDQRAYLHLRAADRRVGAAFDRFGLVTTWIDGNGQHVYFDDLTYTCSQD